MDICWPLVTCAPSHQAILALKRSWAWLVPEPWTPALFSVLGDVFLQKEDGQIYWFNTGTGELALVADSTGHFESLLKTEIAVEWFMPSLVEELREAGKIASAGECYTYVVFPVFAEGGYDVENLNVVPASEHFALSGQLHAQIADVPDGGEGSHHAGARRGSLKRVFPLSIQSSSSAAGSRELTT